MLLEMVRRKAESLVFWEANAKRAPFSTVPPFGFDEAAKIWLTLAGGSFISLTNW